MTKLQNKNPAPTVERPNKSAKTKANKAARVAKQDQLEQANRLARAAGLPSGHERALEAARIRRASRSRDRTRQRNGNYLVVKIDRTGTSYRGIEPCCSAKSYFKCDHNPTAPINGSPQSILTRGRFYSDLALNTKIHVR